LLSLDVLLIIAGYLLVLLVKVNLLYGDVAILAILFSIIIGITLYIFFRGQTRDPESQTFHSLVSVSLKFLLELILAVVWFIIAKKKSPESVFMFFVIYLTLSLFLVYVVLKTLKNRSL
jgi:hypothetical protein